MFIMGAISAGLHGNVLPEKPPQAEPTFSLTERGHSGFLFGPDRPGILVLEGPGGGGGGK